MEARHNRQMLELSFVICWASPPAMFPGMRYGIRVRRNSVRTGTGVFVGACQGSGRLGLVLCVTRVIQSFMGRAWRYCQG